VIVYAFHGQIVHSAIALPDLPIRAAGERPEPFSSARSITATAQHPPSPITIRRVGPESLRLLPVPEYDIQVDDQDRVLFLIPEGAVITLHPHGLIEVATTAAMPEDLLCHVLIGQVLPNALVDRGMTPLHASAVRCGSRVWCFVGDSGLGKSTMAAAFLAQGSDVLCDDVTPLSWQNEHPWCHPGPGRLKLWPDVIAALQLSRRKRRPIHGQHLKSVVDASSGLSQPQAISRIFHLVESPDGIIRSTTLTGPDAVPLLYSNIFGHRRTSTSARAEHFARTTRVAMSGRLAQLAIPRSLERLPEVMAYLAAQPEPERSSER